LSETISFEQAVDLAASSVKKAFPASRCSGTRTNVRAITTIGQHFYLAGIKGIFKRDRYGVYSHISEQVMDYYQRQGRIPQFVSVDGFSETDMYALEESCVVWHYDGEDWELEDLPVNIQYCDTTICAPDGNVYLVANAGEMIVNYDLNEVLGFRLISRGAKNLPYQIVMVCKNGEQVALSNIRYPTHAKYIAQQFADFTGLPLTVDMV